MPSFTNDPVISVSTVANAPAVQGEGGDNEGVRGVSHNAHGGVVGINDFSPADPPGAGGNGGWFESAQGEGVRGWSKTPHHGGVVGVNSAGGFGVYGKSDGGIGVVGESLNLEGVRGLSHAGGHGGVVGINDNANTDAANPAGPGVFGQSVGTGVWGASSAWMGVYGSSESTIGGAGVMGEHKSSGAGIIGMSAAGIGVFGTSDSFEGMHAETRSTATAAMAAYQMNPASDTAAFFAKHMGNRIAGRFEGDVEVTGDIRLPNADCAENFDLAASVAAAGSVMVVGEQGRLQACEHAYDRRVVGVVSGAGCYRPAIVLDARDTGHPRAPIALIGKVVCWVDAREHSIAIGDLLTTSPHSGHAMKAADPARAFGAVIGKALEPLPSGTGEIAILIALQ